MSRRKPFPNRQVAALDATDYGATGPTAQLLEHRATVLEQAEIAGHYRRRTMPAHRRLRKAGKISREAEAAAQEFCDKMQVVEFGGVERSDNPSGMPSERCMVAYVAACRDYLRRARLEMGDEGMRLVTAACYACLPMREVALLLDKAPSDPTAQSLDAARKRADRILVTSLKKLAREIDARPKVCQRQASSPVERPEPSQDNS